MSVQLLWWPLQPVAISVYLLMDINNDSLQLLLHSVYMYIVILLLQIRDTKNMKKAMNDLGADGKY